MNTPSFVEWTIDNVPTHAWLCHSNVDIDVDAVGALDGFLCLSTSPGTGTKLHPSPVLTSMRYHTSIVFPSYVGVVEYLNRNKLVQIPTTTAYKLVEKLVLREI